MKEFKILRWRQDWATFGQMMLDEIPLIATFELPWRNNEKLVSCIPKGAYFADIVDSPKNGKVYELRDVPGRNDIQIHVGNFLADTNGCPLTGKYHGVIQRGVPWKQTATIGILDSKKAFKEFMLAAAGERIHITITGVNDGIK